MSESCFQQVGQVAILNSALGLGGSLAGLSLRLFSNDRTPARTDVIGDYNEMSGGGYAAVSLVAASFTVTPGDPSQALYADFGEFDFTGTPSPDTCYGAFITDANGILLCSERFDNAPFTVEDGTLIKYKPRLLLGSLNPV